ncbi:efflux RND transporter periplasmic adaptor subunit [Capnocytophaga canimorsus]|uniref:efflux RND transporter periplasmic adaptor subunit n=1 Tax=Capnocytophaga canimorsus TaxID=28188 RepID=UPI0028EA1F01|nr:efflux RND transporter periplasmic adaptor subunit [Capnocytophaga canimorsus]MDT9500186.1 efflux RND transporter periplasmic adaptor subunit [Capnocytophaga canimorsus]
MKYINIQLIVSALVLLASCGETKNPSVEEVIAKGSKTEIRQKRDEISAKIKELETQIASLDASLSKFPEEGSAQVLVSLLEVKDTLFNHFLELQGTIKTTQNITLNAEFGGVLERIHVQKGQNVQKGQLLASIQDGGISQQLAQLKIQAELAKTTFERQSRLWENKIGSEIQYLQAKSAYETQQSAVEQMQKQVAKANIYAPFSGVIDDVITDVGTVVAPGMSVLRLVNLSDMYLESEVPEQYVANVKKGSQAKVDISVLGEQLDTKISQVSNFINPANRSFKVEIRLPNKNNAIKPNMTARLQVNDYQNKEAILLPTDIISENAQGEQYVFLAKKGDNENQYVAERVVISTGKTQNGFTEILSGIQKGDKVIREGARSVQEGQRVSTL